MSKNERLTVWEIARDIEAELLGNVERKEYADMSEYEEGRDNLVYSHIENALIYYADGFNLLWDMQITDFSDAINEGCTDLMSIVGYHLNDALYEELDTSEAEDLMESYLEELPSQALGYDIIYKGDGVVYCADCASSNVHISKEDGFTHWEGESLECDECGEELESEYGVPGEDEEEDEN